MTKKRKGKDTSTNRSVDEGDFVNGIKRLEGSRVLELANGD